MILLVVCIFEYSVSIPWFYHLLPGGHRPALQYSGASQGPVDSLQTVDVDSTVHLLLQQSPSILFPVFSGRKYKLTNS
jgi:hypothetical protein